MSNRTRPAILALAAILAAAPAGAWSNQGHMASGAIVHDLLARDDPAAVGAIRRLMAAHPDRARFDAALGDLTGAARDQRLFELIARWADDVHDTPYAHPDWHQHLRVVAGWRLFGGLRVEGAASAYARNLRILRDAKAAPADRAIALCWVVHIVGDMHQPLHAGHRMDGDFPLTDRAGSIAWVRPAAGMPAITFHQFWDRAADRAGADAEAAEALARDVEATVRLAPPPGDFANWEDESATLAAGVAYRGVEAAPDRAAAPVLPRVYVDAARSLSERRLGEAGVRMARLLQGLFPANR
jgi:hypothetical protein